VRESRRRRSRPIVASVSDPGSANARR
jgi:hypothetical protein